MTNKDILHADLLDIIFEHRNKDYGAYALRKGYNIRLLTALGAGISVIVLLLLVSSMKSSDERTSSLKDAREELNIRSVVLPKQTIKEAHQSKQPVKQKNIVRKMAQAKYTAPKIVETVKDPIASVEDLEDKTVSTKNSTGEPDDKRPVTLTETVEKGPVSIPVPDIQPTFDINERDPQYPGGAEAMRKFLSKYLSTPNELQPGEKKVVKIRFQVDRDGTVNTFEIVTSGGSDFDQEVVRVCKKMPRWMPAIQNGINVPVSYVLPVTFMGLEE